MRTEQSQSLIDDSANPEQIHHLSIGQLEQLAGELRHRIIDVTANNGGHLAPSLGVVELTLAILSIFDMKSDKLIWDVGHQAYAYKLLTKRSSRFHSLRTQGGLSGFPRMDESEYDHFGVGHSSTSISAALGMALARDLAGLKHHVLAVIGDGSLTAGEAFEGLNLAGHMGRRLIVVLNDNEMSISPNVGALSLFLSRTLSQRWVRQARKEVLKFLRSIPKIGHKLELYALRGEWSFKSFFTPGMLFEAFRFNYIGPVDGHDLVALRQNLQMAAAIEDGPVLLHVRTKKGKGYEPAEKNPSLYHGIGARASNATPGKSVTFTQAFAASLMDLAKNDSRIIAITAAMPDGTGTNTFQKHFPDRFIDTGICEQHAVTFAAGLATQGFRPVVAIYSTFLQRAYDQVVHDVCLQNLPVTFCIDRAGLVGEDGPTHHGIFDISFLRHIPHISILVPRDENMLGHCLCTAIAANSPVAIRYPRGKGMGIPCETDYHVLPLGKGEVVANGEKIAIIALGNMVYPALTAAKEIQTALGFAPMVFDPIWAKPLPTQQLTEIAKQFGHILVIEESSLAGGFSSAILELLADNDLLQKIKIKRIGIPDRFIEHATQSELRANLCLDANGIASSCIEFYAK